MAERERSEAPQAAMETQAGVNTGALSCLSLPLSLNSCTLSALVCLAIHLFTHPINISF